jgi:hypothetical protein
LIPTAMEISVHLSWPTDFFAPLRGCRFGFVGSITTVDNHRPQQKHRPDCSAAQEVELLCPWGEERHLLPNPRLGSTRRLIRPPSNSAKQWNIYGCGRIKRLLVSPLRRRSHRPMWPHTALRAVAEIHVHECLIGQRHFARQPLEVAYGLLIEPDRQLSLEALGIRVPDRV